MMKYLIIIVIILFSTSLYGQNNNIYIQALELHLEKLDANDKKDVYLEYNWDFISINEKINIDNFNIVLLDFENVKAKTRKKNGIYIIRIQPIQFDGENLTISIIDFFVTKKGKNYVYANGGGSLIKIIFECEKEEFILKRIN